MFWGSEKRLGRGRQRDSSEPVKVEAFVCLDLPVVLLCILFFGGGKKERRRRSGSSNKSFDELISRKAPVAIL